MPPKTAQARQEDGESGTIYVQRACCGGSVGIGSLSDIAAPLKNEAKCLCRQRSITCSSTEDHHLPEAPAARAA